jgi:GT2 family glycosyltransferase
VKIAVIMPCYGEHHYTDAALEDFVQQDLSLFDLYLVDNKGDYDLDRTRWPLNFEKIDSPNLRWLRGTNYGTEIARKRRIYDNLSPYDAYLWINNDVRLSPGFVEGLCGALRAYPRRAGIIAPSYNDVWQQQVPHYYAGPAGGYVGRPNEHVVRFVDGAGFMVTHECLERIGQMDGERFGNYGWGGDFDYCIRARQAAFDVVVTQRAYFNHVGGGTNKLLEENYKGDAGGEMHSGMLDKYGPGWEKLL